MKAPRAFDDIRGMARMAGLLTALAGCAVFWGCASTEHAAGKTFRVMSYNIHHGEGLDGRVDLERIAALIKSEGADIVGLQEVDKGVERTQRRDLPDELARLTGMTCVFSNNYHFQGGEYGNAVLTRFPVVAATNDHYRMLRAGEQRGILQVVLRVHGRELVFMNTHIDFRPDDSERVQNAGEIKSLLSRYGNRPIILCGDFNDVPGSRTYQLLAERFSDAWLLAGSGEGPTIPAKDPRKRIDYIWVAPTNQVRPLKLWVPRSEASDHLPVVGELEWR